MAELPADFIPETATGSSNSALTHITPTVTTNADRAGW